MIKAPCSAVPNLPSLLKAFHPNGTHEDGKAEEDSHRPSFPCLAAPSLHQIETHENGRCQGKKIKEKNKALPCFSCSPLLLLPSLLIVDLGRPTFPALLVALSLWPSLLPSSPLVSLPPSLSSLPASPMDNKGREQDESTRCFPVTNH